MCKPNFEMKNFLLPVLLLIFIGAGFSALAQGSKGKIKGFIMEASSEAPIPFGNVVIKGSLPKIGTVANEDGYYVLNNVPNGSRTVVFSAVGYKSKEIKVKVVNGGLYSQNAVLEEDTEVLDDVVITADRQKRETKVLVAVTTLDPKEITQFSVGGDPDIIKALQVLPGVITTGDQGGQVYIRGGAPIQNLILLDGMVIYNPFHSIGFFSVFDVDIIRSADVYSGGFAAEYGSRNSAVMDIQTRDPNRKRFAGKLSSSTYTSKLLLEAPLGAKNKNGFSSTSVLVSGKTSYLDRTSSIFYPYVETEFGELPFSFNDIYGKLTTQSNNGSKLNLFGFSFDDAVRFGNNNSVAWNSIGGGADFTVVPPGSSTLISGDFSYSQYEIVSIENGGTPSSSGINGFNGGLDFTYFLRENDEFKYGVEAIGYSTIFSLGTEVGGSIEQIQNTTEFGTYFQYKLKQDRLIVQPGIRIHHYSSLDETSFEPRIGVKYNINDYLRVKASGGWFSQNLIAANNDRDVVNLFYGFLSGTSDVPSEFRGEPLTSDLQKATHIIAGFEIELNSKTTVNIEGYIKDFSQITNLNRNKIYEEAPEDRDVAEILVSDYIVEQGNARGLDFLIKYQDNDLNLWLTYSLGKITRDDGITVYAPHFDRRHNLNFVGNYSFGKDKTWEMSLRYNFGTGFPFTPTQAYYGDHPFTTTNGQVDAAYDYTTENGDFGTLYGDLNTKRLPNYHRVDFSIKKTIKVTNNQTLEVSAGATNILNYENVFYFDTQDFVRVNQLPIMPTLSLNYTF